MAAGFIGEDSPMPQPSVMNDALAVEQRIQAAGEGGEPVVSPDLEDRIKATTNQDELRALMESEGILWGATS